MCRVQVKRITPRHLQLAIRGDEELDTLIKVWNAVASPSLGTMGGEAELIFWDTLVQMQESTQGPKSAYKQRALRKHPHIVTFRRRSCNALHPLGGQG